MCYHGFANNSATGNDRLLFAANPGLTEPISQTCDGSPTAQLRPSSPGQRLFPTAMSLSWSQFPSHPLGPRAFLLSVRLVFHSGGGYAREDLGACSRLDSEFGRLLKLA